MPKNNSDYYQGVDILFCGGCKLTRQAVWSASFTL